MEKRILYVTTYTHTEQIRAPSNSYFQFKSVAYHHHHRNIAYILHNYTACYTHIQCERRHFSITLTESNQCQHRGNRITQDNYVNNDKNVCANFSKRLLPMYSQWLVSTQHSISLFSFSSTQQFFFVFFSFFLIMVCKRHDSDIPSINAFFLCLFDLYACIYMITTPNPIQIIPLPCRALKEFAFASSTKSKP